MTNINLEFNIDKSFHIGDVYCKYYLYSKSKPVIITFSKAGNKMSQKDSDTSVSPWGFDFIKSQGLNVISFTTFLRNNWYRSELFEEFIKNFSKELDIFPERLGYGGSMGGYGVSAYSNLLNMDRILIINPISTLNKDLVPFETRFFKAAKKYDWTSGESFDGAETNTKGYIIYDPIHSLDKKHADRYKNLIHLKVPGVGHSMAKHLNSLGILKWIFKDFVTNTIDIDLFYQEARKRRTIRRYYQWMLSKENSHLTDKRKEIILAYKVKYFPLAKKKNKNSTASQTFVIKPKHIELFRDAAIALESIDIQKAYELMSLAKELRPSGSLIKKKLNEYKKLVE